MLVCFIFTGGPNDGGWIDIGSCSLNYLSGLGTEEKVSFDLFFSLMVTIISAFLCGWPGEAMPKSFTNRLARPDIRRRSWQEFVIWPWCW